jgi:proteasome lid subunit RPN8/RPN11
MMRAALARLGIRKTKVKPGSVAAPRLILTQGCVAALRACLEPEIRKGHEGISYLAGRSDGTTTLGIAAMRPEATTTRGSFNVSAPAMARIVRAAATRGLQVVGQIHTHPGEAYHSDGDEDGARIAYTGYVSLVLPDYGRRLPAFDGAAIFMFRAPGGFVKIGSSHFTIIPELLS